MKKYKLLKWYPSLPKDWKPGIVAISTKKESVFYEINEKIFTDIEIQNNPEFWEEVKEETYKILEFGFKNGYSRKLNDKGYYTRVDQQEKQGLDLDTLLNGLSSTGYYIFSVERLLDGKVFSIEDKVYETITGKKDSWVIKEFSLKDKRCFSCGINIESFEHKKEPITVTEDGIDLFVGDKFFVVDEKSLFLCEDGVPYIIGGVANKYENARRTGYLWFGKQENALKFIQQNKPQYSEKQVVNILRGFDKEISCEPGLDAFYLEYINKYKL